MGPPVSLCARPLPEPAGTRQPLAEEDVPFTLDGSPRGSGRTDGSGHVCVPATAPPLPGVHAVVARFAGTRAYLPSHADGALLTVGVPHVAAPPPASPAGLLPPLAGPPPPPRRPLV